jgi:hypothetical protein
MFSFLRRIPVMLAFLVLAAHFLRAGQWLLIAACFVAMVLAWVPRKWTGILVSILLAAGAMEWLRTMTLLMRVRQMQDEPWIRMVVILGSVAVFTVLCIVCMRDRFATTSDAKSDQANCCSQTSVSPVK